MNDTQPTFFLLRQSVLILCRIYANDRECIVEYLTPRELWRCVSLVAQMKRTEATQYPWVRKLSLFEAGLTDLNDVLLLDGVRLTLHEGSTFGKRYALCYVASTALEITKPQANTVTKHFKKQITSADCF